MYDVTVRRIDDLLEESGIHSVDLIKMDIEGSEYHALRGAAKTLTKHRPVVIIELNEGALRQCGSSSDDVIQLLGTFGYRGWLIGRSAIGSPIGTAELTGCDECLFVHGDDKALIRKLGMR